jgi:hypothetical protein
MLQLGKEVVAGRHGEQRSRSNADLLLLGAVSRKRREVIKDSEGDHHCGRRMTIDGGVLDKIMGKLIQQTIFGTWPPLLSLHVLTHKYSQTRVFEKFTVGHVELIGDTLPMCAHRNSSNTHVYYY